METIIDYGNCIKNCPICHGLGFIRQEIDDIHDPQFGKLLSCPNSSYRYWDNSIGIELQEAMQLNWDKYIQTEAVKTMRNELQAVLERGFGWLYIYGEPGNGKTIMAKSAAIYSYQIANFKTKYIKYSDMLNNLRASYDEEDGQRIYENKLKYYQGIRTLVIDELGRDRNTKFTDQTLSDIIDKRYVQAINQKGITIWVSNFKPEDILEDYQIDRIRDGRFSVLEIQGSSIRPVMKYQDEDDKKIAWWHK